MPNERLRALLLERGETPDKLAEAVSVDPKTVERWVTKGRTPARPGSEPDPWSDALAKRTLLT